MEEPLLGAKPRAASSGGTVAAPDRGRAGVNSLFWPPDVYLGRMRGE